MINFSRSFDLAWERTATILFRPFDLGKWFAIGFSAFLAGLLEGGNGFNGSGQVPTHTTTSSSSTTYPTALPSWPSGASHLWSTLYAEMGIFIVALLVFVILAVGFLMYWLGSRGEFMLLDNVVRNRGAIAWPWQNYARLGNSVFGFYLLWVLVIMAVTVPVTILAVLAVRPLIRQHVWPVGAELAVGIGLGVVVLGAFLALGVIFFLFRELGIPLMFRRGILAQAAFAETWRLVVEHPGSLALFVLLRVALFLALVIVSVLVCCFSCCLEVLPYAGTVLLLPAILYIKCFTLECLAQFGPEYDVWTVDVPPAAISPQPPPG